MSVADDIIQTLKLEPHPEGGHFVECFKTKDISIIYYLLKKNEKSHWHRLIKNETLHFYKGDPLIIYLSSSILLIISIITFFLTNIFTYTSIFISELKKNHRFRLVLIINNLIKLMYNF